MKEIFAEEEELEKVEGYLEKIVVEEEGQYQNMLHPLLAKDVLYNKTLSIKEKENKS